MKTLKSMPRSRSYPARPPLLWGALETPAGPLCFAVDAEEVREIRLGGRPDGAAAPSRLLAETERLTLETRRIVESGESRPPYVPGTALT